MLTGDRRETAEYVASQIGLTEVHSGLLPGDKVDEVEKLIQSKSPKGKLVFVGDVSMTRRSSQERISESPWEVWGATRQLKRRTWSS